MMKATFIAILLYGISIKAINPGIFNNVNENINLIDPSVNKPVLFFNSTRDWIDMMIDDSWNNFTKLKSFTTKNFGNLKENNDLIFKISEVSFLSNGRDANLKINFNTSDNPKSEIRSYYIRFSMTLKELEEFDKYWRPNEFDFTYGNLKVEPWDLSSIGMVDLSSKFRYSSLKNKVIRTDNLIFYPPYLNVMITPNINNNNLFDVTFLSSRINNFIEIEKVNVDQGNQDFHNRVRDLVHFAKSGSRTDSKFVGDEIKKLYQNTAFGDYWDSYPNRRFISKIQLAGTIGSFIDEYRSYYGLIGRGDKYFSSNEMKNWVNYLSYALGKNYIAIKKYDQSNLLTSVCFIPVNQDFNTDPSIVSIELKVTSNTFFEDNKEELVLIISNPLFGFLEYEDYWVPILENQDWY